MIHRQTISVVVIAVIFVGGLLFLGLPPGCGGPLPESHVKEMDERRQIETLERQLKIQELRRKLSAEQP